MLLQFCGDDSAFFEVVLIKNHKMQFLCRWSAQVGRKMRQFMSAGRMLRLEERGLVDDHLSAADQADLIIEHPQPLQVIHRLIGPSSRPKMIQIADEGQSLAVCVVQVMITGRQVVQGRLFLGVDVEDFFVLVQGTMVIAAIREIVGEVEEE